MVVVVMVVMVVMVVVVVVMVVMVVMVVVMVVAVVAAAAVVVVVGRGGVVVGIKMLSSNLQDDTRLFKMTRANSGHALSWRITGNIHPTNIHPTNIRPTNKCHI